MASAIGTSDQKSLASSAPRPATAATAAAASVGGVALPTLTHPSRLLPPPPKPVAPGSLSSNVTVSNGHSFTTVVAAASPSENSSSPTALSLAAIDVTTAASPQEEKQQAPTVGALKVPKHPKKQMQDATEALTTAAAKHRSRFRQHSLDKLDAEKTNDELTVKDSALVYRDATSNPTTVTVQKQVAHPTTTRLLITVGGQAQQWAVVLKRVGTADKTVLIQYASNSKLDEQLVDGVKAHLPLFLRDTDTEIAICVPSSKAPMPGMVHSVFGQAVSKLIKAIPLKHKIEKAVVLVKSDGAGAKILAAIRMAGSTQANSAATTAAAASAPAKK